MKKIIVPGRPKDIKRFHCPVCGCVFDSDEYISKMINDVAQVKEDGCPICKAKCYVYCWEAEDEE